MDTRHAQHDALRARPLYRKLLSAAAIRQWRALARASSLSCCARSHSWVALPEIVGTGFSAGPICRRRSGRVRKPLIGFFIEEAQEAALDRLSEKGPFENECRIQLHERRTCFDLGERCLWAINTANADERKLVFGAEIGLRQHMRRSKEKRTAG